MVIKWKNENLARIKGSQPSLISLHFLSSSSSRAFKKRYNYIFINTLVDRWKFILLLTPQPPFATIQSLGDFILYIQLNDADSIYIYCIFFLPSWDFSSFNLHSDEIKNQQSF